LAILIFDLLNLGRTSPHPLLWRGCHFHFDFGFQSACSSLAIVGLWYGFQRQNISNLCSSINTQYGNQLLKNASYLFITNFHDVSIKRTIDIEKVRLEKQDSGSKIRNKKLIEEVQKTKREGIVRQSKGKKGP
jgi:hypothetical protein